MPDIQHSRTSAECEAHIDWMLLDILTDPDEQRPWSLQELQRELGRSATDTADAARRLYIAGLVHRTSDGFVFATRAAVRYQQILQ